MDRYSLTLPLQSVQYLRRLLGTRPHDEVRPLVDDIEQQCARQDQALQELRGNGAMGAPIDVEATQAPPTQ